MIPLGSFRGLAFFTIDPYRLQIYQAFDNLYRILHYVEFHFYRFDQAHRVFVEFFNGRLVQIIVE